MPTKETSKKKKVELENNSHLEVFTLPEEEKLSSSDFEDLWKLMPTTKQPIIYRGQTFYPERRFISFGRDYAFSGQVTKTVGETPDILSKLLNWAVKHSGVGLNGILVNFYPNREAAIGAHSDDERQLKDGSPIYSLSFGDTRDFVVKSKKKMNNGTYYKNVISLKDNTCLIMSGEMQKHYTHAVPKRVSKESSSERRVNVTFRHFK